MIYLDYAATTPVDPAVKELYSTALDIFGNPSSVHGEGQKAKRYLEEGREQTATALGCKPRDLAITSGGTESDAMAIYGVALAKGKGHIVSSAIEHSAVLTSIKNLSMLGFTSTLLMPDGLGRIFPEQVLEAIRSDTILVSILSVNNELGTIYPTLEISKICKEKGVVFHTDAVQAFGTIDFSVESCGADLISIAAHKFYGPKGVGALYHRRGLELFPIIPGKQEQGFRGGTENVIGALGMGLAAEISVRNLPEEASRLAKLQSRLEQGLLKIPSVELNSASADRSPKHVNVTAVGADGEGLLLNMDVMGIAVSSGSACASGSLEPSHVLIAIGRNKADAKASVRFSLGRFTTESEIDKAIEAFGIAVSRSR